VLTARKVLRGASRGAGHTVSTVVAVPLIAVGVPAFWVWLASQVAGSSKDVTPSLALFITVGILVSYWLALLIGSSLRRHWVSEEEQRKKLRRMSWNRSFRDEPNRVEDHSDPIERIFVIAAVLGFIAFEIWFFFFAGSPLPSQPLF
jgi:4-amino-4-deoxy-L-arabinose transferase-like glycosyltransferase